MKMWKNAFLKIGFMTGNCICTHLYYPNNIYVTSVNKALQ